MVRVYGPALSLDASGTIADAITFAKWKGRNYARQRVIPANPRSGGQVGVRAMFKFLSQSWSTHSAIHQATFDDRADDQVISPFNAYMGYNQARWRNFRGPSLIYPADEAGAEPAAPTTTPTDGVRQISLSIAAGSPGPNWGYMIFRSGTTGFNPAFANCIAVVSALIADPTLYVDTPLALGTYYYRIRGFMNDGKLGLIEAEITDTVVQ